MTPFVAFTDAQWAEIQAARAGWPADIDWAAVRLELERAGRDFWTMRANRLRRHPKAERARLQRALNHLHDLKRDLIELNLGGEWGTRGFGELERVFENRLAIYEAWSSQHFRGHSDAHRELLYLRVIQQWTGPLQGELQFSRADEAAAGPAVRYLLATLIAVLGAEAPGPAGIAKIIAKARRRPEDLYFKRQK